MVRPDIAMTETERAAFLSNQTRAVVASQRADGWPTAVVAAAMFSGDFVVVEADVDTRRVCCIAEESPAYDRIKGVIAFGTVVARAPGRSEIALDRWRSFDFGKLP